MGFSVPRDISVIGFDNQQVFDDDYTTPGITSMRQPLYQIGRDSLRLIEEILQGKHKTPIVKTYDTQLVERDTVAAPPKL
jgi:DNA-binding LacI/PurR family transcriptional regulator